jgi:hypothetical protein
LLENAIVIDSKCNRGAPSVCSGDPQDVLAMQARQQAKRVRHEQLRDLSHAEREKAKSSF